jgi:hypothetical protein
VRDLRGLRPLQHAVDVVGEEERGQHAGRHWEHEEEQEGAAGHEEARAQDDGVDGATRTERGGVVERARVDLLVVAATREQALLLDEPRRGRREGAAKVQREEGSGAQRGGQLSPEEVEHCGTHEANTGSAATLQIGGSQVRVAIGH